MPWADIYLVIHSQIHKLVWTPLRKEIGEGNQERAHFKKCAFLKCTFKICSKILNAKHRGLVIWDLKIGSEMEIKQQLKQHISTNQ